MTKPVTGVAMMMLYEEGKWRLEDPVSRYIPGFAKLKVYAGENADGTPKLEDARRPMTMRELMTHTAGFGYTINNVNPVDKLYRQQGVLDSVEAAAGDDRQAREDAADDAAGHALVLQHAVDVQGYLVEKLSGQPFDEFLRDADLRAARDDGHRVLRAAAKRSAGMAHRAR